MNDAHPQDSLFPDPLGMRLRVAREQAGLSPDQVAAQLRLPLAIVEAMEREDWARLGAPIYVRSYLGGYLKLLGLPPSLLEMVRAPAEQPKLVTLAPRSRMLSSRRLRAPLMVKPCSYSSSRMRRIRRTS